MRCEAITKADNFALRGDEKVADDEERHHSKLPHHYVRIQNSRPYPAQNVPVVHLARVEPAKPDFDFAPSNAPRATTLINTLSNTAERCVGTDVRYR